MSSRRVPAQRSESKTSVASSYDSANGGTFASSYSNTDKMRKGLYKPVAFLGGHMIDFSPKWSQSTSLT